MTLKQCIKSTQNPKRTNLKRTKLDRNIIHVALVRSNSNRSANDTQEMLKGKKLGHRRVKGGEVTYKKFETTPLMRSIQLGIHQSVGNLASQEDRDILHEDFYTVETVVFSRYFWPPKQI